MNYTYHIYYTISYHTIHYHFIFHYTIPYDTISYLMIQYNIIFYNIILYDSMQYHTFFYNVSTNLLLGRMMTDVFHFHIHCLVIIYHLIVYGLFRGFLRLQQGAHVRCDRSTEVAYSSMAPVHSSYFCRGSRLLCSCVVFFLRTFALEHCSLSAHFIMIQYMSFFLKNL